MSLYLGTFLIAFATLSFEVTLTRLLSVITWYHLSFFAVSTAMLGMTAGATAVYLKPLSFTEARLKHSLAMACLWFSVTLPLALILLCIIPLDFKRSIMSMFALLIATLACALPFYFSGVAVSAVLTKSNFPIGKLYASDLIGASLGCLFVLGGLEFLDAPSLILLCGSIGAAAALAFAWRSDTSRLRGSCVAVIVLLAVGAAANSASMYGVRPLIVKGRIEEPSENLLERWNSFSRIVVKKGFRGEPPLWGPSPVANGSANILQYWMTIDGQAGTILREFSSKGDIEHLRFDVTNAAYYLRPSGGACIIGVGGGRDIQSAILFGHERIVGST